MGALTPRTVNHIRALAQWTVIAAVAGGLQGVILLLTTLAFVVAKAAAAPERLAGTLLGGAIQVAFGILGIVAAVRLARYGTMLALAARLHDSGPLDEGAAHEMSYWRLATPMMVYHLFAASATLLVLVRMDLPDIDWPDIVAGCGAGINSIAAMFAVVGAVMVWHALRPPR